MNRVLRFGAITLLHCFIGVCGGFGAVRYVDQANLAPASPYASWGAAATNIQDAIEAAAAGDLILVTNGTYRFGGKYPPNKSSSTNRVVLDKALTVLSVNGPQQTVILGSLADRGIACAFVTNGAVLSGFTLTAGNVSDQGGGSGSGAYCASTNALITNCIIFANSAGFGGGVYSGTIVNCIIRSNYASSTGGGAYLSVLKNCEVSGNLAPTGAGAASVIGVNCTITANAAASTGGGAYQSTLNNSIVWFNSAPSGSNYFGCALNYCCAAPLPGSGAGNIALNPQLAGSGRLSEASPCRNVGSPAFASGSDIDGEAWLNPPSMGCDELVAGNIAGPLSVAVAGTYTNVAAGWPVDFAAYVTGEASAGFWNFGGGVIVSNQPFAIHAWPTGGVVNVSYTAFNQDHPAGVSAFWAVNVATQSVFYVAISNASPAAPYSSWETAANDIQSALDAATLPGQIVLVSNGVYQTGGRKFGAGGTTNRVVVERPVRLASANGPEVTTIMGQRASSGGGLGVDAVRCVYLASGAVLEGFTLMNGSTANSDVGGGVYAFSSSAVVTNCLFHANYAYLGGGMYYCTANNCYLRYNEAYGYGGGGYQTIFNNCTLYDNGANLEGGGASYGTLNNCLITNNVAINKGGGVRYSTVNNCVFTRNNSDMGGGAYLATLNNCTLCNNYGYVSGGGSYQSTLRNCINYGNGSAGAPNSLNDTLNFCCTTPMPANGIGNLSGPPGYVNQAAGNLRLQSNSPCINSGRNLYVVGTTDLDGVARIAGGTVDMGAYEFQTPASTLSFAWAQLYGIPLDGSADFADADGDGMSNWQEWMAGTNPTNAASALRMMAPTLLPPASAIVSWSSVTNKTYALEFTANLGTNAVFSTLATNIAGKNGTTAVTNSGLVLGTQGNFRVRVEP